MFHPLWVHFNSTSDHHIGKKKIKVRNRPNRLNGTPTLPSLAQWERIFYSPTPFRKHGCSVLNLKLSRFLLLKIFTSPTPYSNSPTIPKIYLAGNSFLYFFPKVSVALGPSWQLPITKKFIPSKLFISFIRYLDLWEG